MTFKVKDGVVVGSTTALDANGKLATGLSTARTISLSGDVTGSTTFDGTSDVTIAATIAANSVALGTDTTGNYVASLVAGTGISVGTAGEGATPTVTNTAPNVTTDISITHDASTVVVNSSDGADGTVNAATTSLAGVMSAADKTKLDGIATGANNYTLPTATSTVKGGVELFSDTVQSVAANAVSATASRTYGVQLNSEGQAVVNVPWTDTTSGGTVTSVSGTGSVSGLTLSGTVTGIGSLTLGGTLSLTSAQVTTALGYTPYNSSNPSGYITSSGSISGSAGSVSGLTLTSSANGINPDSVTQNQLGYNNSVSLFGQTDGGLYSSAYSSSWVHQIYGDFRTGQIAIRGKNSGTWQAWRTVLDSSNYSNYAVKINDWHGNLYHHTDGRIYSTIYYDANDSGYYVDANNTSNLAALNVGGSSVVTSARYRWSTGYFDDGTTTDNFISDLSQNGHLQQGFTAHKVPWSYAGNSDVNTGIDSIEMAGCAVSTWHDGSYYTSLVIRPTTGAAAGTVYIYNNQGSGYSPGWRQVWTSASTNYNYSDIRSPLFYDVNNTGYYCDPASSSRLNTIYCGDVYNDLGGWFRSYGTTGSYNQSYGTHFYSNGSASWGITGSGGNVELQFRSNHQSTVRGYVYGDTSSNFGLLNQNGSWKVRVNGSDTEIYDYTYTNDLRSYIVYDRNDTGYYSDPNSGSSFNGMTTNNHYIRAGYMLYSDHGSWTGEYNKIQWHSSHLYLQNAGGGNLLILRRGDGGERFWCDYNGNVTASGNITANSDITLKTNVQTIENARELVKRLRGVTFDWIESGEHSYGVIAQEVEKVLPELVLTSERNTAESDTKRTLKSVDYSKLTSVLIEAAKEQDLIIQNQEARIKRLESLIEKLI